MHSQFRYGIVALVGALTFGTDVDRDKFANATASNYLYVFPPNHYMVTILRFGLVFSITLLFAVINFPMLEAGDSPLLPFRISQIVRFPSFFVSRTKSTSASYLARLSVAIFHGPLATCRNG